MNGEDYKEKVPPYFYFYTKYCRYFDLLTAEQAGEVIKHICNYVRQEDLPQVKDVSASMLITLMEQDIDNAFKKYRAQCENGKKGGAPKGNKNAAKKKKDTVTANNSESVQNLVIDEINGDIAYRICDIIYLEAKKADFAIDYFYKKVQIAEIATCYCIGDCESFNDFGLDYANLKDFTLNESTAKVCKTLKEIVNEWFEDEKKTTFCLLLQITNSEH
ncbi:MAG: hypothetical protein J5994_08225 [Ruminococcus sp.]|nr:hypothetical protein [Ruminococcus sp.]